MHNAQPLLPHCTDRTAYVTLWSAAAPDPKKDPKSTFMRTMFQRDATSLPEHCLLRQVQMVLVLLRSIRRAERVCQRDFILMLGAHVQIPFDERGVLEREGVRFVTVRPLMPGVPTADKLWAWSVLSNYSQCLLMDADVMVLQPLDDIFGYPEDVTIAHHAYDNVQAQCGIPLERRGIAAMFVMRPNQATFRAYVQYVRTRLSAPQQRMYADQTGLMCFFGLNRTRTLPCSYLADVANPLLVPGPRKWKQNCNAMLSRHLRLQCIRGMPPSACEPEGGLQASCNRVLAHLHAKCAWRKMAPNVRAVHFKGKVKPWPFSSGHANHMCRPVMFGPLTTLSAEGNGSVGAHEDLVWDESLACTDSTCGSGGDPSKPGACVTAFGRARVYWRDGRGVVPRKCCHFHTILQAHWNWMLTHPPVLLGGDSNRSFEGSKGVGSRRCGGSWQKRRVARRGTMQHGGLVVRQHGLRQKLNRHARAELPHRGTQAQNVD